MCKGSTADSDSVCLGSNPSSAANSKRDTLRECPFYYWLQNFVPNPVSCQNQRKNPRFVRTKKSYRIHLTARIGFAFERKPPGSLLTSGEVKILAFGEYPSSATLSGSVPFTIGCRTSSRTQFLTIGKNWVRISHGAVPSLITKALFTTQSFCVIMLKRK